MGVFRFIAALLVALTATGAAHAQQAPLPVRVVIVTAFEIGADTGDAAGEFQAWAGVTPQAIPFPAGFRHLRYDPKRQVLLLSTGIGTNRAAASTMALGLDPRFDLTKAYWLVAAIAGVNPDHASVGSAAWIGDVVDSDYGYAVDPREAPAGWTTGMFARGRKTPYEAPRPEDTSYNLFPLNTGLRDWAYCSGKRGSGSWEKRFWVTHLQLIGRLHPLFSPSNHTIGVRVVRPKVALGPDVIAARMASRASTIC